MKRELTTGMVYWLRDFTAPKVFNGLYFECLLTDQKIAANKPLQRSTGIMLKDWKHKIYKPERFKLK